MQNSIPRAKRAFDLVIGTGMTIFLMPLLLLVAGAIAVLEGRPVLYVSRRRLGPGPEEPIVKFRTMCRDADRIANRDTIPVSSTRFLNLPITSPLYTSIGRLVERLMLTEMPQLLHVFQGRMSIIGNRPLPENVVAALREEFTNVEDRFLTPAGLTGPVQLVGRDLISDADRLEIEAAYCNVVMNCYSPMLDLKILVLTIVGGLTESVRFTPAGVIALLAQYGARGAKPQPRRRGAPSAAADAIDHDAGAAAVGPAGGRR